MKRTLLPSQQRTLSAFGENIKYARLRRDLSSEQVAERAGISRNTLIKIEKGEESVAIGFYFRVLAVLGCFQMGYFQIGTGDGSRCFQELNVFVTMLFV